MQIMAKYAKIIDRGECFSTTNLSVNGIPANKYEWEKHNFYLQNGMVGEIINVDGALVLKILDGVYVPMTYSGIVEITYEEYESGKMNNVCVGMDARQRNINKQMDALIEMLRKHGL